jgi:hypothetical protein
VPFANGIPVAPEMPFPAMPDRPVEDPTAKILRLNEDGSIPRDNPFVGRDGYSPEIFTLGHRTPLGLAVHPGTGQIWETENGPNASDEVNVLVPGGNYGWPLVSLGRTYQGPWHSQKFHGEGGLPTGEIIGTGSIQRILMNENVQELRREALLTDLAPPHAAHPAGPGRAALRARGRRRWGDPADRAAL